MQTNGTKKILVVEDEEDVMTYLVTFFKANGFDVLTAKDGKEGFEIAKNQQPDLISLDINMPEETGVRMYRNLHEDTATKGIPVVMITGVPSDFKRFIETRKQVEAPAGYFEKPIDRDAVLAKINEILNQQA
ncbi:response regulator [Calditrichota bacterium]